MDTCQAGNLADADRHASGGYSMADQMDTRARAARTTPEGTLSASADLGPARAEQRIDGIQWLRAILSVFVVVWHLGGAGKTGLWDDRYLQHQVNASDIISFQILLLAVPGFMLISNYLLAAAHPTGEIAWKRTQRVIVLLLFWPLALTLFQTGWGGVVAEWPKTGDQAIVYVLTAGYTVFYFFVSLLLTYGVTLLAMNLSTPVNIALLAVSTAIVAASPIGAVAYKDPHLAAYWSPLNFLPYSFAGLVILRLFGPDSDRSRATGVALALIVVGMLVAAWEWQTYRQGIFHETEQVSYPTYTRASLVFHATALLIVMIHWAPRAPAVVEFMAKHSLALYCLHLFMAEPLRALVRTTAPDLPSLTQSWIVIPLAIVASYITSRILMQVWRERLLF
jgi:peptidoglycan/LPS O-acetylase OafA/YrhL